MNSQWASITTKYSLLSVLWLLSCAKPADISLADAENQILRITCNVQYNLKVASMQTNIVVCCRMITIQSIQSTIFCAPVVVCFSLLLQLALHSKCLKRDLFMMDCLRFQHKEWQKSCRSVGSFRLQRFKDKELWNLLKISLHCVGRFKYSHVNCKQALACLSFSLFPSAQFSYYSHLLCRFDERHLIGNSDTSLSAVLFKAIPSQRDFRCLPALYFSPCAWMKKPYV